METIEMSSPWVTYWHKLQCLFGDDPDIKMAYDEEKYTVRILVDSVDKASALAQLLNPEIPFGNVTLKIEVVPANNEKGYADLVRDAFRGNPHFHEFVRLWLQSNPICYAIFEKEVAQYYNDNMGDAHGNISTLYEELAREIIGQDDGVYFCTDNGAVG